jgi:tRNA pseudouridine55 synthase
MPSGILLLDKPLGLSSNAALQRVRALYGREKAGHTGSLDPLATGMLPVCLGQATKVAGELLAGRKRYRFRVALGTATATGDAEGAVTQQAAVPALTSTAVWSVLGRFQGAQRQVPPMYSALKRGGRPLYELARAGLTVPRAARSVEIFELTLSALEGAILELETLCSKGTYVRVLAQDIAAALGTCGHVTALRRLYVEPFGGEPMHTLESLQQARTRGEWPPLLSVDWPLGHLPMLRLERAAAQRFLTGQKVPTAATGATGAALTGATMRTRVYDAAGTFLGLGETDAAGMLQPRRLMSLAP